MYRFIFSLVLYLSVSTLYAADSTHIIIQNPNSVERPDLPFTIGSNNFIIHYGPSTSGSYAQNTSDYAEYSYQRQCTEFGWPVPPPDDNRGGDNRYDIYLVEDGTLGVTRAEIPTGWTNEWAPSYIEIRNNLNDDASGELKITVAHEFNHATQIAYTYRDGYEGGNNFWFYENTATLIAEEVYNYQYKYYENSFGSFDPLTVPGAQITSKQPADYLYSGFLWPKFLSEWQNDDDIVRAIWQRMGETLGPQTLDDIDYTLVTSYENDLSEALRIYAEWRYFTGVRDDGYHFQDALSYPTSSILRTHSNNIQNQSFTLSGPGGTQYVEFYFSSETITVSMNGSNNQEYRASAIEVLETGPPVNHQLYLDASSDGTVDAIMRFNQTVVFAPVQISSAKNVNGTYSASNPGLRAVMFTNEIDNDNAGGQLTIDGQDPLSSGELMLLEKNTSHSVKTLDERFILTDIYKHNHWNADESDFLLSNDFLVPFTGNADQDADFEPIKPVTIRNVIDGISFNDGVPIEYNDPWYVKDQYDNQSGMGNFLPVSSPYSPTGHYIQSTGGVFLDQLVSSSIYYSVRSPVTQDFPLTQTGRTHKFYFQDWSSSGTDPLTQDNIVNGYYESPVVFRNSNAIVTANLKGTQLSNNVDAYTNSQRKFVQTPDGTMHIVYESMDGIWYEISTDGGSTWRIMNDGKPLNTDAAKKPSMDYHGNVVAIVFQENNGGYYDIKLSTFYATGNDYILGQNTLVNYDQYDTYASDANPVIGWGYNGRAIIVWAGAYDGPFYPIDALVYKYCSVSSTGFSIYEAGNVLNSTDKSANPTVYYNEYAYSTYNFHLAWEEQTTSTTSKIYYQKLYPDGNDEIQFADYYQASYGSGYSKNYRPAIVSQDFQNIGGRREVIRLSWIGYRDTQQGGKLQKVNAVPSGETRVLHKNKLFSWSGLSVFGDKVVGMSQNHGDNIFNYYQAYALGWSEDNYGTVTNKYIRSHESPTTIRTLNTDGKQIQVNNSTDYDDMYVNSFKNSILPYSFDLSESLSGGLSKVNSLAINQGREGVVIKDNAEFYFAIGDIILNGENVNFVEYDDSLAIGDQEMLNDYLLSLPFSVNDNTSLTYGVQYGIVDSASAVNALSDGININFKLQLIDDQTGEVLGLFDDITYSQDNVFQYNNIGYQLDMTGIGNRTVRLKLAVNTESESDYSLSKRFADEMILGKLGYNQVKYQGSLAVTDYAIEQNYPNPFNPSTTIRYQIPQNGIVTLKVYDILGREIVTLVNEEKSSGRYEVNFNASTLASGVYLYRLKVNDYVDVKKMILLK